MPERKEIEIYVILDSNGDYAMGVDLDTAYDAYNNEIGGHSSKRTIRVVLYATTPAEIETVMVEAPELIETLATAVAENA